jgi:hypothetical protein
MVKEAKSFRKQAAKAECLARSASDPEISQNFLNMESLSQSGGRVEDQEKVRQKAALIKSACFQMATGPNSASSTRDRALLFAPQD